MIAVEAELAAGRARLDFGDFYFSITLKLLRDFHFLLL
jgi:hypothetical protein